VTDALRRAHARRAVGDPRSADDARGCIRGGRRDLRKRSRRRASVRHVYAGLSPSDAAAEHRHARSARDDIPPSVRCDADQQSPARRGPARSCRSSSANYRSPASRSAQARPAATALDRGGNRPINAAMHGSAVTRGGCHARRATTSPANGPITREAVPFLKRHLACRIWYRLQPPTPTETPPPLRERSPSLTPIDLLVRGDAIAARRPARGNPCRRPRGRRWDSFQGKLIKSAPLTEQPSPPRWPSRDGPFSEVVLEG
jgi:hypothetical protein